MTDPERGAQRVFFALWPDAATAAQLHECARLALRGPGSGRLVAAESLHLTLAFIGPADAARYALLCEVAARVRAAPVDVALDRLGVFRHGGVLHAGMQTPSPTLVDLHARLTAGLAAAGAPTDSARFTPHVTLARHTRVAGLPSAMPPIAWRADEFVLVESQLRPSGARYRVRRRFPLAI